MEKVVIKVPDYKSCGIPSGNAIAAQRQQQHATEQGKFINHAALVRRHLHHHKAACVLALSGICNAAWNKEQFAIALWAENIF